MRRGGREEKKRQEEEKGAAELTSENKYLYRERFKTLFFASL